MDIGTNVFAVLSTQRSGTKFLQHMLSAHPEVSCIGEVFLKRRKEKLTKERIDNNFYVYAGQEFQYSEKSPSASQFSKRWRQFIEQKTERDPSVRFLGFTLMYNQLNALPGEFGDQLLCSTPLVHLIRKNVLRTHISDYINTNTNTPGHIRESAPLVRIELPVSQLFQALYSRRRHIEEMRTRISGLTHTEIFYEDVLSDRKREMEGVQEFIGIVPKELSTSLRPTNPFPLREMLENYDEVESALKGTEFEAMLKS